MWKFREVIQVMYRISAFLKETLESSIAPSAL